MTTSPTAVRTRVCDPVTSEDLAALRHLAALAQEHDGYPSLGDSVWRNLAPPDRARPCRARPVDGVVILGDASPAGALETAGALHLARNVGTTTQHTASMVVHPDHREGPLAHALVEAAIAQVRAGGGGHLTVWIFGADGRSGRASGDFSACGLILERELWQMRIALPCPETPRWPPGVRVRTFEPGRDEAAWLEVNNRAFVDDPDQGGWTPATLAGRVAEAWFDPSGFLLAFDDRGLAGFCWTKVHPGALPHDPEPLGEIYVIGVDPDRQGTGLGRALVLGGLASLHDRGIRVGMLFVAAGNAPAVSLYRALGFRVTRVDRAYGRVL